MSKRLSVWSLLAFSSPAIPATLLIAPVFGILPSYYALHTKVTLAEVGAAFLIARIVDALIDPLVGVLSDRTRSRWGARIPWMAGGAVLALPSAYFFFLPPADAGGTYFFVWSFLTMAAWTLLTIPHGAWAAEMTDDYDERSRIFGVRNVLASVGAFGFFLLPPLLEPVTHTTEINGATMQALVVALFILTPVTLIWAALRAPVHGAAAEQVAAPPASLMSVLRSVGANRPFVCYVGITVLAGVAAGMTTGLSFLYTQDYLGLGAFFFLLGIIPSVAGIAATPVWLWAARRVDKHRAWAIGLWLGGLVGLPILFLTPGAQSFIPLLVISTIGGIMQSVGMALPSSILADVADYEAWKQNTKAVGNYFALLTLLSKITTALGSSLALLLSGVLGYVPRAQGGTGHVAALVIPFVILPVALNALAGFMVWFFPLNRRRHAVIMSRLAKREERRARAA
ncbi:MAG: MFS transporter [Proteobacteria bacterium]|nr:MFS transporter [Pseudomonadota bacterium]